MLVRIVAITLFSLLINFSSIAQFKKADKMVGASIGNAFYNSGTQEADSPPIGSTTGRVTGFGLNITPTIGWFVSEKTAAGFSFTLNPASQKTSFEENGSTFQKDEIKTFSIGIGGFARNYFNSQGSFLPFGQANLNAGISSRNTDGFFYGGSGPSVYKETYEGKSSGGFFTSASLSLGFTKMVGENAGLDFSVGYTYSYAKNTMKTTTLRDDLNNGSIDVTAENETTTKFTNHGFMLGVGFQIFIKSKKK
jgi:hypothetical protein